ncbi:MAG TPA: TIR domain-containing protein [Ktedonobacteraceae bacterium]|nr:TIR domain-containing protein [Ktedonobacteraceae bacterium]
MSPTTEQKAFHIFCSYAYTDETFLKELEKHLVVLRRQNLIADWYEREVVPGVNWKDEIDTHLKTAKLVLFLISPDFIASDYRRGPEVELAIARHEAGEARVIPVILRSSDLKDTLLEKLQALPTGAKPIASWFNRDEAFLDVTRGIRKAVKELLSNSKPVISVVEQKDFFISYYQSDRAWAEWIAHQLEDAEYSSTLQSWDFEQGTDFVQEMEKATEEARRIITVLSPDYVDALARYPEEARQAAFKSSPRGEQSLLVPVHVRECRQQLTGLLSSIVYIDLVGRDEDTAREKLLAGVQHERRKPVSRPVFPGMAQSSLSERPAFPTSMQEQAPPFPGSGVQSIMPKSSGSIQTASLWNVPYHRNPFFIGREDILERLHQTFMTDKAGLAQTQIISGLDGIGKTQIAVEYAYRYRDDYQAVLWVRADTRESMISDFAHLADLLDLPEKNTANREYAVSAVNRWLNNATGWLLILDNVEDLRSIYDFIPYGGRGHVLLTTCAQAAGTFATGIELETVQADEGALFLLRRSRIIAPDATLESAVESDIARAREISERMGGLPLALDQAGAFIEETACSLDEYLELYQKQHRELLKQRGDIADPHPEPVATTWLLSFEKVERANPAAAELLYLCAFLQPDAIPEEIIIEGASMLGPILQPVAASPIKLKKAIAELLKYSLVRRDSKAKTLSIHRLVQLVIKDSIDERQQRLWAKRAIKAVERACNFREETLGSQHSDVAQSLSVLAYVYQAQGKYVEAESCYQRALAIYEDASASESPYLAGTLKNYADLLIKMKRSGEAAKLSERASEIEAMHA